MSSFFLLFVVSQEQQHKYSHNTQHTMKKLLYQRLIIHSTTAIVSLSSLSFRYSPLGFHIPHLRHHPHNYHCSKSFYPSSIIIGTHTKRTLYSPRQLSNTSNTSNTSNSNSNTTTTNTSSIVAIMPTTRSGKDTRSLQTERDTSFVKSGKSAMDILSTGGTSRHDFTMYAHTTSGSTTSSSVSKSNSDNNNDYDNDNDNDNDATSSNNVNKYSPDTADVKQEKKKTKTKTKTKQEQNTSESKKKNTSSSPKRKSPLRATSSTITQTGKLKSPRKKVKSSSPSKTNNPSSSPSPSPSSAAAAAAAEGISTPKRKKSTTSSKPKTPPSSSRKRQRIEPGSLDPPPNWESIYTLVEELRADRTAPMDADGGQALPERHRGDKVYRYQVLTALMLSSQTKDAVVGDAIRALQKYKHGLDVESIKDISAEELSAIIGKVGFYNNKTKFMKQTAEILIREYDGDIPPTAEKMMGLPGIGPKMVSQQTK